MTASPDVSVASLDVDERSGMRAYLQRTEVRLSTIHRVASALLSGAGLMVLLPAVERDTVVSVVRALVTGEATPSKLLLLIGVAASLALPFTALWLVLRDLTQFYFHANHVRHGGGESFTPRFTLTGLRLPDGELRGEAADRLGRRRREPRNIELLVAANDVARAAIDDRIVAYGGLGVDTDHLDDEARAAALFELAAARARTLEEEVAKVEHGLARHVLRIQTIVLRYVKALLALLTTALAAFAAAAVVDGRSELGAGDETWLAGIFVLWAPIVILAVSAPVRWLDRQLRSEGATHTAVASDRELTRVEDVTIRLAIVCAAAALAAMAVLVIDADAPPATRAGGAACAVVGMVALTIALRVWSGGHPLARLVGRGTTRRSPTR